VNHRDNVALSQSQFAWVFTALLVLAIVIYAAGRFWPMTASADGAVPDRGTPITQTQSQSSPQGPTGPIDTTSGGAPASSPQGDTPPGMQAAPQGSAKSVAPKN
jgi:hypothetical protein